MKFSYAILFVVALMHLLALLAFHPYFFSWSGVWLMFAGIFLFGVLGINIGYHRYLAHSSFQCHPALGKCLTILGVCCLEKSPLQWVATHRQHHQSPDMEGDPHSPWPKRFWWGHMGWIVTDNSLATRDYMVRWGGRLCSDPLLKWLDRKMNWLKVYAYHAIAFFVAGLLVGGLQLAMSWLIWGVVLRTVIVWHQTWLVNSAAHLWGYRTFDTHGEDRNNWFVGLIANGEGWHNNHHAIPRSARHGLRWYEIDTTYYVICFLERVGLVWDVVRPTRKQVERSG